MATDQLVSRAEENEDFHSQGKNPPPIRTWWSSLRKIARLLLYQDMRATHLTFQNYLYICLILFHTHQTTHLIHYSFVSADRCVIRSVNFSAEILWIDILFDPSALISTCYSRIWSESSPTELRLQRRWPNYRTLTTRSKGLW